MKRFALGAILLVPFVVALVPALGFLKAAQGVDVPLLWPSALMVGVIAVLCGLLFRAWRREGGADADSGGGFAMRAWGRRRAEGVTMVEVLLGLTAIAIVVAGGIAAFQTVQVRTEARAISNALMPFVVDMAEYLQSHHNPDILGSEATLASSLTNGGVTTITSPTLPVTTSGACSDTSASTEAACIAISGATWTPAGNSALHVRIANLPSVQFNDKDGDGAAEWNISIDSTRNAEIRWVVEPAGNTALGGTNLNACAFTADTTKPDTTVAAQLFFEDKGVCDEVAKSQARFDVVQAAQCQDADTVTTATDWHAGKTAAQVQADEYTAALFICFNDMR